MRVGWLKQVRINSHDCYPVRKLLTARETLVRIRVKIENELRGLLRTFGVLFGKRVSGFTGWPMGRGHEIICGELETSSEMRIVAKTLMKARASVCDQIKVLDTRLAAIARANPTVKLFMTAPGIGPGLAWESSPHCQLCQHLMTHHASKGHQVRAHISGGRQDDTSSAKPVEMSASRSRATRWCESTSMRRLRFC